MLVGSLGFHMTLDIIELLGVRASVTFITMTPALSTSKMTTDISADDDVGSLCHSLSSSHSGELDAKMS